MNFEIKLIFPPGWSFVTGSPHLALPLLKSFLESNGIQTSTIDLNWEIINSSRINISDISAKKACENPTLDNLNSLYFAAEEKLGEIAVDFSGHWNAQLGFEYNDYSYNSSEQVFQSSDIESPFTNYFKNEFIPTITEAPPNIIAFSIASVTQLIPTFQLCKLLRGAGFNGIIVLGGNTVSRLANEMAIDEVFNLINCLVVYQGEIPLLELCKAIKQGLSFEAVPQLIWRDDLGNIKFNNNIAELDLDSVQAPDLSGLPVGNIGGLIT